jgi:hypothetical protein
MAFWGRQLFVLVLIFSGPNSYLTLIWLVRWNLENELFCTCIIFCWTRQLFNTTFIGAMTFWGRQLCVLVLHSAEPDIYLALLSLVPWHLEDESYLHLYYNLLNQTVIQQYFNWSRDVWRTGIMCTCITFCWTRQLFSTTLIVPLVFGGR